MWWCAILLYMMKIKYFTMSMRKEFSAIETNCCKVSKPVHCLKYFCRPSLLRFGSNANLEMSGFPRGDNTSLSQRAGVTLSREQGTRWVPPDRGLLLGLVGCMLPVLPVLTCSIISSAGTVLGSLPRLMLICKVPRYFSSGASTQALPMHLNTDLPDSLKLQCIVTALQESHWIIFSLEYFNM